MIHLAFQPLNEPYHVNSIALYIVVYGCLDNCISLLFCFKRKFLWKNFSISNPRTKNFVIGNFSDITG